MKPVRSSKNKTQILCHLVRREPAWIIAEPDVSHLSKWSFSNLLLCSIISACPRVCEKHSHSLGFAITAGTEAALSPRSRSPSVCHWGVLWTFQMVCLFIYLLLFMRESGQEWTGSITCAISASLSRIFSALKAGWPLAASKWRSIKWFFSFGM